MCVIWWYSLLDNVRSHIITTIRAIFPGRVLARISILLWFKVPREHFENIRNWCHTPIGLHTQTKPNPIDILGNIEILARMRPGKMAHMVTLLQQHLPYYRRRYTVYRTPRLNLSGKWIIRGCAHLFAHMSKGVFRSLTCKRQTTDSSNLLSCSLSVFWLLFLLSTIFIFYFFSHTT